MTRLMLPATILACLATIRLVAASAPARPAADTECRGVWPAARPRRARCCRRTRRDPVRPGRRSHLRSLAAGLGDIAGRTPMRADNHFKIASLTKTYTATVVLQLVGEGKLRLDDTVERRLPGVVPNGGRITIRQLLNHTSGLVDFENDPRYLKPYLGGNFAHYWEPRQLVRMAVSHKPLFVPGAGWSYSNTNYVVAQLIVEKITGKPLGAELKRRIFQPLGRDQTSYPTKPGFPTPYAHGYRLFGELPLIDVTGLSPSLAPGSGAIVSTVRDVADFYRALLSGRLLKPEQLQGDEDDGVGADGQGRRLWPGIRARHRAQRCRPSHQPPSASRAPAGAIPESLLATT